MLPRGREGGGGVGENSTSYKGYIKHAMIQSQAAHVQLYDTCLLDFKVNGIFT